MKKAGNATRTRDILLGKEVFYQLNYTRAKSFFFIIIKKEKKVKIISEYDNFLRMIRVSGLLEKF